MARKPTPDPRTLAPTPAEESVLPVVALPRQGLPKPVLIALAVLAAVILFAVLDSRRRSLDDPSQAFPQGTAGAPPPAAAPPLIVPGPVQPQYVQPQPQVVVPQIAAPAQRIYVPPSPPQRPQIVYVPQPSVPPAPLETPPPISPGRATSEPALVIDTTGGQAPPEAAATGGGETAAAGGGGSAIAGTRARSGALANRSTTVPQGTLIPAVMETAFNSTRPGLARAIVSRDVRGFDGTRVLIPRGSRLVGEYRADAQPGQRRALINWLRLIRPDGVTISIASPSTDTLGRGGIRANVNSHFFERFAGSLMRSVVDVGVTLAAGAANAPVVLLPGALGALGGGGGGESRQIQPTLTVRQGTSISVFVARDLDFTGSDRRR
ncbi:MAG TPA: TrbI/VirB10 family protein [Allosphingosinicella sp.]